MTVALLCAVAVWLWLPAPPLRRLMPRPAWRRSTFLRSSRSGRAALPELCRLLAADVRSGSPPGAAMAAVAAAAPPGLRAPLSRAAAADRLGLDATAELVAGGLAPLAAVWNVGRHCGAGLGDGADRIADALAAAEQVRAEARAALAGPRASAALLAVLPLLGLALAAAAGTRPWQFLLRSPPGLACLGGGVTLDLAGWFWTRRILRSVTP